MFLSGTWNYLKRKWIAVTQTAVLTFITAPLAYMTLSKGEEVESESDIRIWAYFSGILVSLCRHTATPLWERGYLNKDAFRRLYLKNKKNEEKIKRINKLPTTFQLEGYQIIVPDFEQDKQELLEKTKLLGCRSTFFCNPTRWLTFGIPITSGCLHIAAFIYLLSVLEFAVPSILMGSVVFGFLIDDYLFDLNREQEVLRARVNILKKILPQLELMEGFDDSLLQSEIRENINDVINRALEEENRIKTEYRNDLQEVEIKIKRGQIEVIRGREIKETLKNNYKNQRKQIQETTGIDIQEICEQYYTNFRDRRML